MNRLRTAMAVLSLVVAGFCSAGLSHGVVWSLTALRVIDGPYTAYRHDAIAGAVLAAAVSGGVIGIIALACAFASGVRGGDAWFAALQRTIADIGPLRAFLIVVAVQFGAIIGLEGLEQVVQLGHTLGPSAALGVPLVVGIPIHAFCAFAVAALVFGIAQAVVRAESHIWGLFSQHIRRRTCPSPASVVARESRSTDEVVRPAPLALRFANRPPPSLAA